MAADTAKRIALTDRFSAAAMENAGRVHVIATGKMWRVKRAGAKRATSTHPTKGDAIESAQNMGRVAKIVVHQKNGSVDFVIIKTPQSIKG